ncbi:aldose 1-epimerase family protein [Psychroserpens damuponensis]|uniref:aldose 1-epimerase family protein n=1 Tax=Psychroserpens damuponensis TaxID=943936 RepID=UPI0006937754|nr:aldose 1-epimerase family protein [Psychroserpens damuponensis]
MLHTIENEHLICNITSNGAEIRSLKNKSSNEEYIWQIDNSIWGSSSPVLFPAIGKIKDDKLRYDGKEYTMPKHGIIRHNNALSFEQQGTSKCVFNLTNSNETLKQYPFKFSFSIVYTLFEHRLIMNYLIENRDTKPMYFSCGGHTAYACPLNASTKLSDYVIEFPTHQELKANTLGASGLLTHHQRDIETINGVLPLSNTLFNEDALIFTNIDYNWVRLRKKNKTKGIIVSFKNYPHLALWSKPGADYVCIEPWLGLPDLENESLDITQKSSYKRIDPGVQFSIAIETEIEL